MINIYKSIEHKLCEIEEPVVGSWLNVVHPTQAEVARLIELGVPRTTSPTAWTSMNAPARARGWCSSHPAPCILFRGRYGGYPLPDRPSEHHPHRSQYHHHLPQETDVVQR